MKKLRIFQSIGIFFLTLSSLSCSKNNNNQSTAPSKEPVVVTGTGDIASKVDAFRKLLGDPLNVSPGKSGGRREINWDGVPDQFITNSLPANFFNATAAAEPDSRKRGLAYAAPGDFRVSSSNFANIEPSLSTEISSFSGDKVFANTTNFQWDVTFMVPGEDTPAEINGFGAVFSDVDQANISFLEFFSGATSLGKFFVPPHNSAGSLSFLGVYFDDTPITRVTIAHGNGIISAGQTDVSKGGAKDIVALDDFLYDEPVVQK